VTQPLPKKPLIAADRDETGVPLSSLDAGSRATVLAVDVSTSQGRRLCDLGFMPETEVRVVRRAPLGDPIIFYLRGGQICLRRAEAERIRVCALGPADEP
jgi:ferrous iron transport protein A